MQINNAFYTHHPTPWFFCLIECQPLYGVKLGQPQGQGIPVQLTGPIEGLHEIFGFCLFFWHLSFGNFEIPEPETPS